MTTASCAIATFCHGSKAQFERLKAFNIETVKDLWEYVASVNPPVRETKLPLVIHKRCLIRFLNIDCKGLYFDLGKLYDQRDVLWGGSFPDQWIGIR